MARARWCSPAWIWRVNASAAFGSGFRPARTKQHCARVLGGLAAQRPPTSTTDANGADHESRFYRARPHGRRHGGEPSEGWSRGHRIQSHAEKGGGAGREWRHRPCRYRGACEGDAVFTMLANDAAAEDVAFGAG